MTPFWDVDINDDSIPEHTREAAEFLIKVDSEGGLDGFLAWGGVDAFPPALHQAASDFSMALAALEAAVEQWAADCGVEQ